QIVGRAAHHPAGVVSPKLHRAAEVAKLVGRLHDLERAAHVAAARRRLVQRERRVPPLQVVELRERSYAAAERRVLGRVGDPLAAVPERRGPLPPPLQNLLAAPGAAPVTSVEIARLHHRPIDSRTVLAQRRSLREPRRRRRDRGPRYRNDRPYARRDRPRRNRPVSSFRPVAPAPTAPPCSRTRGTLLPGCAGSTSCCVAAPRRAPDPSPSSRK